MDVFEDARRLMFQNRRVTDGNEYTVPSGEHYPYQWLWDSCFHAIVLAGFDPEYGKNEIRSLLSRQFKNGMVPHIIYWVPGALHQFNWGVEGTSSITQPPMLAYAVEQLHRTSPDTGFLEEVYPALASYYKFLIEKRDPLGRNLIAIINPDESGEDNSPRFDAPLGVMPSISYGDHLELRKKLAERNGPRVATVESTAPHTFWVFDVLFNAVLVENLRALRNIAHSIKHEEGERYAKTHSDLIRKAMRESLWHNNTYWSLNGENDKPLMTYTWAQFVMPLFAGLYSQEEAESVVKGELMNPESFYGEWGLRTVSKKELSYQSDSYASDGFSWRGPSWMVPHWFMYRGLMRYGFHAEADKIRDKSVRLLENAGFRECFNPESGIGHGAHGFTWGALILDMQNNQFSDQANNDKNVLTSF
jgi:glycogen debranching enzyme